MQLQNDLLDLARAYGHYKDIQSAMAYFLRQHGITLIEWDNGNHEVRNSKTEFRQSYHLEVDALREALNQLMINLKATNE